MGERAGGLRSFDDVATGGSTATRTANRHRRIDTASDGGLLASTSAQRRADTTSCSQFYSLRGRRPVSSGSAR